MNAPWTKASLTIIAFFVLLVGVVHPVRASMPVTSMNPAGYNSWDYYVFGNGQAIYEILQSIKLLMVPIGGSGTFRSLLIAIALIGGFISIVEAGLSPSKGVEKVLGYFVLLGFILFFTLGARVNVTIDDQASSYFNTVTGVPAIVGVPAAMLSEIGHDLEHSIEKNFSIPDNLKVSTSGMYDVMGQTMQDANKMVISEPYLREDLSGYIENCVVPTIGLGRLSVNSIMDSNNLWSTLSSAASPALVMPVYFPSDSSSTGAGSTLFQQGTLMNCATAYTDISAILNTYGNSLINAQSAAWASSGIMIPFGTAMSAVLSEISSGGGNTLVTSGASPESYILQSALVNTSKQSFQHAAASLGEDPVMLSTAIAQADQIQRSSWYTTVTVFHNMIGYVYIVLQAFVLAIVPIIAALLLLPGMGGKIFMNYIQVLLWLVLWGPLFAVNNFIVAVVGGAHFHNLLVNGLTLQNSAIITQATVNLNLAASFLGTLIPIFAWGVVKGSFGFTEFIMHGMGTAFGQQAGSIAATGNESLGNTSMDNVSMNKYSTAITSDIGYGGVNSGIGAGALSTTAQMGGYSMYEGRKDVTPSRAYKRSYGVTINGKTIKTNSLSSAIAEASAYNEALANKRANVAQAQSAYDKAKQAVTDYSHGRNIGVGVVDNLVNSAASQASEAVRNNLGINVSAGAGISTGSKSPAGADVSGSVNTGAEYQTSQVKTASSGLSVTGVNGTSGSNVMGEKASSISGYKNSESKGASREKQWAQQLSFASRELKEAKESLSQTTEATVSESYTVATSQASLVPVGSVNQNGGKSVTPNPAEQVFTHAPTAKQAKELKRDANTVTTTTANLNQLTHNQVEHLQNGVHGEGLADMRHRVGSGKNNIGSLSEYAPPENTKTNVNAFFDGLNNEFNKEDKQVNTTTNNYEAQINHASSNIHDTTPYGMFWTQFKRSIEVIF